MEVDVEILDVTDEEARKLLLSIDPLAPLAKQQEQLHERLCELTPTDCEELQAAWHASTEAYRQVVEEGNGLKEEALTEQFMCSSHAGLTRIRGRCWRGSRRRGWSARLC